MTGVTVDGKLAGGPLVEIIGRCIVRSFAFLLLGLATCIRGVFFLIRSRAQGPFLVEPLAILSKGFNVRPNLP
jgi:hypothetical protein